ncbi:hypothetical protein R6Q59_031343, partial [Mikania micrantha]
MRYVEAIHEFNKILLYIYKTKQYHQQSPQYEQILKKNEQMYALLTICLSLCPQVKLVDETVNSQLREKYGEKMSRMQQYDNESFALYDELFSCMSQIYHAFCTKLCRAPWKLQQQQQQQSIVTTFLKVYLTISLEKLASYMDVDESTL